MRQFLQEAEALGFIVFDSEKLHRLLANKEYVGQLTNLIVDVFTDGFIENFH
jgi:hypothetical protein